ncbi:RRP12-like protein [Agrilus planipennis]|uniref:RRP12-like protein n=1 Tax=Agrilus planipennis TaxID=224129 RepID=A0A1W4XQK5_AGRPL|nr:RRP12-like protein [Agrilus planipennis]
MTNKTDKNRGFKTADDGRLIIDANDDSSDSERENKKRKKFISLSDTDEDSEEDMSSAETAILTNRKRKRNTTDSLKSGFSGKSQPPSKYKPGGSGIHRDVSTSSMYSGTGGSEYKAKKAGGDIKKKDKADPYAYLPLKRNFLNKRKKAKLRGQFKNIVKSAKIGAKKGSKANKKIKKQ